MTNAQSSVHPILYTPPLPNASSLAEYAAYAVTGIPTSGAAAFTNFGYPAPTYGCHAFMNFTSPSGTVSCKMSAPTPDEPKVGLHALKFGELPGNGWRARPRSRSSRCRSPKASATRASRATSW